jgi:hypothetical protein
MGIALRRRSGISISGYKCREIEIGDLPGVREAEIKKAIDLSARERLLSKKSRLALDKL